jgi:hypothetical protein
MYPLGLHRLFYIELLPLQGTPDLAAARRIQLCEGPEAVHCKQEGSLHSETSKEEQLRKRREQNRFRMRALRASESEVAQRLRERNKFRMRTLRASDSQVAQSLRERNKYRMREIRSSGSHLTCRIIKGSSLCAESARGEECLPKTDIKVESYLKQGQSADTAGVVDNPWKAGIRVDLVNICTEGSKLPWAYIEKDPLQNTPFNIIGSQEYEKHSACEGFLKWEPSHIGVLHKPKSVSCDGHGIPVNRNNCKNSIYDKNQFHATENEGKGSIKSEGEYMEGAVNCMQYDGFVVGSREVGTCADTNSQQQPHTNLDTVHMKNESVSRFEGQSSVKMEVEFQGDVSQCKERCGPHFLTFNGETADETKILIKRTPSEIREMHIPEILDLAERRREKGKLRMRLKRHSETDEEAERRREQGRLRMRVLRATETEEQAARRRELNRLRMRIKRNSARQ